ncbi:MAG: VOC family protein [Leptolyngbyaceae bacterium]|nr:VOC family protein [Leptolyngbyaceae bacterium]
MAEFNEYLPGTFCWVDLATTDAEAAKGFYTALFGWSATDVPAGDAGIYTMLQKNGKDVCALYQMNPEFQPPGTPPHWLSYVSVSNIDDSTAKAEVLGGKVLQSPCDVMESGRMSLIQDPTGAPVALWQPKQHIGARLANEPSTFCWNELHTTDVSEATAFYNGLFGWTTDKSTNAVGGDYFTFHAGDREMGGMMEIQPDWGEVPPNWVVYFSVENCDATVEQAKTLGGTLEMAPMDIPDVGRFAILQDPQGAYFTIIQMVAFNA